MLKAIIEQRKLDALPPTCGPPPASWEPNYHHARVIGFGLGRSSRYTEAWHPELGLITDTMDGIILRLDEDADHSAFRRDVISDPSKLQEPTGPGGGIQMVRKAIAVSGSLSPEEYNDTLVDAVLELGLPFIFLPHLAEEPISVANARSLGFLSGILGKGAKIPLEAKPRLDSNDWCRTYQIHLWKRLEMLPLPYRSPVIEAVHQLEGVCENIALFAGCFHKANNKRLADLMVDLYCPTLRCITLGIVGLAWHGLGFDPGCPLPQLRKLLRKLRENGLAARRDAQRLAGFKSAEKRDEVLERLASEGLVILSGKDVTAVSLPEFVEALHGRPEFPPAPSTRAGTFPVSQS